MENTQIPSGGSYSDVNIFTSFRFWLIRILAGKSVVILNAGIRRIDEDIVRFKDVDGLLAQDNYFDAGLLITQESKNQKAEQ